MHVVINKRNRNPIESEINPMSLQQLSLLLPPFPVGANERNAINIIHICMYAQHVT